MSKNKIILISAMLLLFAVAARAQEIIQIAPPVLSPLPGAFAYFANSGISFSISEDGQYVMASTVREGKAWKLPTGELVYRFQTGQAGSGHSVFSQRVEGIYMTDDGKFIYPSLNSNKDASFTVFDVEAGKIIGKNPLVDSIQLYTYQERVKPAKYPIGEANQAALLTVKRDFNNGGRVEPVTVAKYTEDLSHPGETIIVYLQEYCGSKDWIKSKAEYTVKELRAKQQKNNHCQFYDVHIARYNPTTGKAVYIGRALKEPSHYDKNYLYMNVSPYGDLVHYSEKDYHAAYTLEGRELWRVADGSNSEFMKFDNSGNIVLREQVDASNVSINTYNKLDGKIITSYKFPADSQKYTSDYPKLKLIEQWGMYAIIDQKGENPMTIGLYNINDGKFVVALTDQEGAERYSKQYNKSLSDYNAQTQANIKANQDAWDNHIKREAVRAEEIRKKVIAESAEHAKYFMTCPKCNGIGYFSKSGYSPGSSKTTEGTVRNTITGEISTRVTTTTTTGGAYTDYEVCHYCKGRREVSRH